MNPAELWGILMLFVAALFRWEGCVETRLSYRDGQDEAYPRGKRIGKAEGEVEGRARGIEQGFIAGKKVGREEGKEAAKQPRASNGWFVRREK